MNIFHNDFTYTARKVMPPMELNIMQGMELWEKVHEISL